MDLGMKVKYYILNEMEMENCSLIQRINSFLMVIGRTINHFSIVKMLPLRYFCQFTKRNPNLVEFKLV